jgi:two-component system, sensor histidine kinase RegB
LPHHQPPARTPAEGEWQPLMQTDHKARISLDWLVRLRWGAAAGQVLTILVAQGLLGARLPLARMFGFVAVLAVSNLALTVVRRNTPRPRTLCGMALTLDTLVLSGLLHASGGAYNPFSVLYLVHITLAAVVLGARWTWFLAGLSVSCFGLLFLTQGAGHAGHASGLDQHLRGMWVAFALAAALTAYFVVKLSTEIETRDAAMAAMRELTLRHERLAAVTTLAAGAAHELGSPLTTIAVAVKELQRSIEALPPEHSRALGGDAALIRSEVDRCRTILDRLAANAGHASGEAPVELRPSDIATQITANLPGVHRRRLEVSSGANGAAVAVPLGPLVQAVRSLLQNAFEAGAGPVTLSVDSDAAGLRVLVCDPGPGMTPEVLSRVGEPFFSTRPPGRGLGLGVFIARTLSEQMGGRLSLESNPEAGTRARIEIPAGPGAPNAA